MPETQPISFSGSDTPPTKLLPKPERHCVGMVLQDPWILSGNICAKMADGWERSADDAVVQANFSYGGVKSSGLGKEASLEAMLEHFTHKKTIMVNMG